MVFSVNKQINESEASDLVEAQFGVEKMNFGPGLDNQIKEEST